jgi:hypothetical protein
VIRECPASNVVRGAAHSLRGTPTFLPVLDIEDLAVTGTSGQPDRPPATLTPGLMIDPAADRITPRTFCRER